MLAYPRARRMIAGSRRMRDGIADREVVVRDATAEDALAVATVHVRAWQAGYRGLLADEYLDALRPEDRAARYTFGADQPGHRLTMVATVNATLLGFVTTGASRNPHDVNAGEVMALHVDPDAWGRGIGKLLLTEGCARLASLGFATGVLWVLAGNERAQHFYRANGWEPDGGELTEEIWGVRLKELRFRRDLP